MAIKNSDGLSVRGKTSAGICLFIKAFKEDFLTVLIKANRGDDDEGID